MLGVPQVGYPGFLRRAPPINSSATKRNKRVKCAPAETQQKSLRNSPLKRPIPIETSTNKQPTAKRTKHSATGSQEKTSTNSPLKRPIETLTEKQPPGKRFVTFLLPCLLIACTTTEVHMTTVVNLQTHLVSSETCSIHVCSVVGLYRKTKKHCMLLGTYFL
jgi:hypothetical protein